MVLNRQARSEGGSDEPPFFIMTTTSQARCAYIRYLYTELCLCISIDKGIYRNKVKVQHGQRQRVIACNNHNMKKKMILMMMKQRAGLEHLLFQLRTSSDRASERES